MDKLREALVKWRDDAPGYKSWRELVDAYKTSFTNNKASWLAVVEVLAYEEALQRVAITGNISQHWAIWCGTCKIGLPESAERTDVGAFYRTHTHGQTQVAVTATSSPTETQKRLGLRSLRHISVQPWDSDID